QAELIGIDEHDLTAADQDAIDADIERRSGTAIQLYDRPPPQIDDLADRHFGAAEFDRKAYRHVEHQIDPPGRNAVAPWRSGRASAVRLPLELGKGRRIGRQLGG